MAQIPAQDPMERQTPAVVVVVRVAIILEQEPVAVLES
jgi:hypothetical protein